jgi:hypothetical protein
MSVGSLSAQAEGHNPVWRMPDLQEQVVWCAAWFELRANELSKWHADESAIWRETSASLQLQDRYGSVFKEGTSCASSGSSVFALTPLFCEGPVWLADDIYAIHDQVVAMYTEMGLAGAFPPTVMEDPASQTCRELLNLMLE